MKIRFKDKDKDTKAKAKATAENIRRKDRVFQRQIN